MHREKARWLVAEGYERSETFQVQIHAFLPSKIKGVRYRIIFLVDDNS